MYINNLVPIICLYCILKNYKYNILIIIKEFCNKKGFFGKYKSGNIIKNNFKEYSSYLEYLFSDSFENICLNRKNKKKEWKNL